jgi:hypothetical protein
MTEVVKRKESLPKAFEGFEDEAEISAEDLVLPKILTMNPLSKMVKHQNISVGQLVDSVSQEILAHEGKPLEVILFNPYKTLITFHNGDFESVELLTLENSELPWDETVGEGKSMVNVKRQKSLNYHALTIADIKAKKDFPRVISFRSTGYKDARAIETVRLKLKMQGQPLPFCTLVLTTEERNKDKHSWFAVSVAQGRASTEFELDAVKKWKKVIKSVKVTEDNSEFEASTEEKNFEPAREF